MEKLFCSITSDEADLIGNFSSENGILFTPFCMEQKNGNFTISKDDYERESSRQGIARVDFKKKDWMLLSFFEFKTLADFKK